MGGREEESEKRLLGEYLAAKKIVTRDELKPEEAGLIVGGLIGALAGPEGVIAGMAIGYLIGKKSRRRR